MNHKITNEIRQRIIDNSDENTRKNAQRYFKETILFHGTKAGEVSKISKELYNKAKQMKKGEVFSICEELLSSGYEEEAWVAASWAAKKSPEFQESDIEVFERWIEKYITDWAKCDSLCNHAVGTLIEMYPKNIEKLKKWTKSSNRWMKRAAAVSLIIPARNGMFLNDIFEIAQRLLKDKDDMVQKGYGWMLKAASQSHLNEVYEYVLSHKHDMPRTAFRYAIEKMPEKMKQSAMKK